MKRPGRAFEVLLALAAVAGLGYGAWFARRDPPSFEPVERGDQELVRVVTWNVGLGLDQRSDRSARKRDAVEHAAQVLGLLDPDLVLLQELEDQAELDTVLARLRADAPGDWQVLLSGDDDWLRVAVLARNGGLRLPRERPARLPERALVVVHDPELGPPLAVAVLHATAFSAEERNRVVGRTTDALLGVRGVDGHLLGGDLNVDIDLGKRRDLFTDDEHLDVETYNYVASRLADVAVRKGPTAEPDRRLDYLFLRADTWRVRDAGPLRWPRAAGMDHDPVVLDLVR